MQMLLFSKHYFQIGINGPGYIKGFFCIQTSIPSTNIYVAPDSPPCERQVGGEAGLRDDAELPVKWGRANPHCQGGKGALGLPFLVPPFAGFPGQGCVIHGPEFALDGTSS